MSRRIGARNHRGALCSIEACGELAKMRGWCTRHYEIWRRHGDAAHPVQRRTKRSSDTCSIAQCDKPVEARGWCSAHWARWKRHGDPLGGSAPRMYNVDASTRFWAKVQTARPDECWLWLGAMMPHGYGHFEQNTAHRFAYEDMIAPIPAGLHLDHLCRVKHCVNPYHLDPVTADENNKRARAAAAAA